MDKEYFEQLSKQIAELAKRMDKLETELKREMSELKEEVVEFREKIDDLETQFNKFKDSYYAVEKGVLKGREMEREIKKIRENFVSDPRGFNSLRWIRSRHY